MLCLCCNCLLNSNVFMALQKLWSLMRIGAYKGKGWLGGVGTGVRLERHGGLEKV